MLDILLHTNQAKIFAISEKPLQAGKKQQQQQGPKKMVHLLFATIYFDLGRDSRTLLS
jgi:hypothetical protein